MTIIQNRYMSASQQKGNHAKFGYVETDLDIVSMELSLIDFSNLSGQKINICDLTGGEGNQLFTMKKHIESFRLETFAYYNEITQERFNICNEKYGDELIKLNSDFFDLKIGNKEGATLKKQVINIARNNPPYVWLDMRGENVRAEHIFTVKHTELLADGGIQIIELPLHQLESTPNLLRHLIRYYEFDIFKFPEEVFELYKQVVVIAKKKKKPMFDESIFKDTIEILKSGDIPYLQDVKTPVFQLDIVDLEKFKEVNIFRDKKITEETLYKGLNDVLDDLLEFDKRTVQRTTHKEDIVPIVPLLPGNIAQLLAAGRFNGINGPFLIRGGAKKIIEKNIEMEDTKEGVKKTESEVEVLKPFLELTNNKGEILRKDF